jgi:outer membrane protein W
VCATAGIAAFVMGLIATPAASAQQSVNFTIGGFIPRGGDCLSSTCPDRSSDDVLTGNLDFLAFNIRDFKAPVVGAEYLVGLGNSFEAGLGVGFYTRTVPTVYLDFVNADGSEIEQDLKLRVVPFTATVRWLPMGRNNGLGIQPYIGAGVGVFNFRYSESGQFLATDKSIFQGTFAGSGSATGPVIVGGLRVPIGPANAGFEVRYQRAEGDLPPTQDFSGNKIDLGGITYNFTIGFRF